MRWGFLALASVLAVLALAAPAGAVTIQVNAATGLDSGACGAGVAKPCRTVRGGANRAGNLPSDDMVKIAAGLYPETSTVTVGSHDVLDGAGSCTDTARCTVIQPPAGTTTVAELKKPGAGARELRVIGVTTGGANNRRIGILMVEGTALTDVGITMQGATNDLEAVRIQSATTGDILLDRVDIHGNGTGYGIGTASIAEAPATLTLRDSTVATKNNGALALGATKRSVIERSFLHTDKLDPNSSGSQVVSTATQAKSLRIDSSLITGGGYTVNSAATLTMTNSTVDAGLPGGSDNFPVATEFADQLEFSSVTDSILLGTPTSVAGGLLSCRNTDVKNTVAGKVNCPSAAGNTRGNTFTGPAALFRNAASGTIACSPDRRPSTPVRRPPSRRPSRRPTAPAIRACSTATATAG